MYKSELIEPIALGNLQKPIFPLQWELVKETTNLVLDVIGQVRNKINKIKSYEDWKFGTKFLVGVEMEKSFDL